MLRCTAGLSVTVLLAAACAGQGEPPALPATAAAEVAVVVVHDAAELRAALAAARAGTHIDVAPGEYGGGYHLTGLTGTAEHPIVVAAQDPTRPPRFTGGRTGIHLVAPRHVVLRHLEVAGSSANGINIDDGGDATNPARAIVLDGLIVRDVGPNGNCDGIKLSGVTGFTVSRCTVERWGSGGSGIDLVGCRDGLIEACTLRHTEDTSGSSGVQLKGGTRDVQVRGNRFEHAGQRAVNLGGSTGLEWFRPALSTWTGARFEARDVTVERNVIIGSLASVACVGVTRCTVRRNTLYDPGRWALRILQETRAEGFVPCGDVNVSENVIAFRSPRWAEGGVNVGDGTAPDTFRFERNVWFCIDAPERTARLVRTPSPETDARHGQDPEFRDAARGDLRTSPHGAAAAAGADREPDPPSSPTLR